MLLKRPLTRFEKVGLVLLTPIILVVVAGVALNVYVNYQDRKSENQVGELADELKAPAGCHKIKQDQYRSSEVFGVSYHASISYECDKVPVTNAISEIKQNLAAMNYDILVYSELEQTADYPDVRARFNYSDKPAGEGAVTIIYQLQDSAGNTLNAPNRTTLNQLPVEKISVEISL